LRDRVLRLLVPFVSGVLVIVPPQVWVERVGHGAFAGSFFAFYPHYFDGLYGFGGNFAWIGLHLWYLLLLFLITVVLAPLLYWATRPSTCLSARRPHRGRRRSSPTLAGDRRGGADRRRVRDGGEHLGAVCSRRGTGRRTPPRLGP